MGRAFFQHPALTAISLAKTLIDSYRLNPFVEAFDHAVVSGELLGRVILHLFPGYLVNLISFSLGTELVKEAIKVIKAANKSSMINQVIFIGGVADKT